MNRIYLVRHAESVANTKGVYQGQSHDTGLSRLGHHQAARLGKHLKNHKIDKIITSPLKRAGFTAHVVSTHHTAPVITDIHLLETTPGQWEGVSKSEIVTRWPEIYAAWQSSPSTVIFPDGEIFLNTQDRVLNWWHEISQTESNIIVVTHSNVIQIILAYLDGVSLDRIWDYQLQPTSVTLIEDGEIKLLNQTEHLKDLEADLSLHAL
jgi:broad specificity phosphatase PhoE